MMNKIVTFSAMVALLGLSTDRALADNWVTASEVGADNASNINTKLAAGGGTGTITINDASTILVDSADIINCTGIIISHASAAITFSATRKIVFANAAGAITFSGTGALAINGEEAAAGFDFVTTAAAKTLTITSVASGTLNDTTLSNRILLGNGNTLNIVAGGTPVINSVVMSGTGTLDIDASATFTAVTNAGATSTTIDVASGVTATVTTPTLSTAVTLNGAATSSVLAFTNAGTLTGTITVTGSAEIQVDGASTITSIDHNATALVLDVNESATITALDNAGGTATTIDIASAKTLTVTTPTLSTAVTLNGAATSSVLAFTNAGTLTGTITVTGSAEIQVDGASTITSIDHNATALVLDVNESATITALDNAGGTATTIDIASGKTLTVTTPTLSTAVGVTGADTTSVLAFTNAGTLTGTITVTGSPVIQLGGASTITRMDATTATITDNGGTTITDLRITPGAGTFTWNGTGAGTVTDFLANSTFATGNIISKAGTGTLTITNGIAGFFSTAGTQIINVTAGILAYGTAGANNNVTFSQDADEITVANGATLTTYGSFTVGAAAANVNLDAVVGSTVNLSATSAKAFTGLADDDFNLLGTVNINGSGTYTIADGFNYKFGSVTISDGCSLVNNQPSGEIKFLPSSTVTLNDSGGFMINGQADGTQITLDTTTGAGSFTVNRTASPNLSLQFTNLSRCIYTSSTVKKIASCDGVSLLGTNLLTGTQNWQGGCGGGGSLDEQNDDATTVEVVIDIEGGASLMTTTPSGASAVVTVSDAIEGQTISITLEDRNIMGTFAGMAGGENGLGNGVPRTLTVKTGLAKGTFKAIVQLCVTDIDLSASDLTPERAGLFVFNETTGEWEVKGTNNRGNAKPTSNVGDHGIFQDGFESGNTCGWAVVDDFSTFIVGEMTTYTLDASASPADSGSVAIDPAQTVYSEGVVVNLTATPTSGFGFTEWLINDQELATDNPLTITMDQDTVVIGQFDQVDMSGFVLGLTQNDAAGGTVTASPQAATYASGTEVTLTATPAEGFVFGGWSGDVGLTDTGTNPLTITVVADLDITGFFFREDAELFTLSVSVEAGEEQGLVSLSPALAAYEVGTVLTLTATPAEGFVFAGWTGDATGDDNPLLVTIDSNLSIRAAFEAVSLDGDDTLVNDDNQEFGTCGAGAGCGALGTLSMCLMLMGLAGLRRSSRHR